MNADLLQGFYVRNLLVEPLTGKVTGPSGNAHLAPRAAEVLVQLASAPGELVTHEDLLEKVWGEGKGNHELLSHAVSEIRHALGDHADDPAFIQTLPRRGYRLIVAPEPMTDSTASIVIGAQDGARFGDIGLLENLKQRGVIETAVAYVILGWVVLQAGDVIYEQLHMPAWIGTFVTVLVFAGFPIALALSWFIEIRQGDAVFDNLSAAARRKRRFSRTYLSVVGALALAGVLVWFYDRYVGLPAPELLPVVETEIASSAPPISGNSIAVLPFLNIDGGDDTQIFANGLVDDVITRLSRVPGLLVSSRGDSFSLPPNTHSKDVRRRLRVAKYLEGSVQMAGDRLRVVVQLIDSESGFHVLSRSFDRKIEDFFQIRDEITDLTVANVRVALPGETHSSVPRDADDPPVDLYLLYRRGIEESRRPRTAETIAAALRWFDEALAVDPDYSAAHAGKCSVHVSSYQVTDDPETIAEAEASCARASALNPNLDVVHTALGDLYHQTGRYIEAESEFLAALESNPKSVEAMKGLGTIYWQQQRIEESEQIARRAIGVQPGNWRAYNNLGFLLFQHGRYEESATQYAIVVTLDNDNVLGFQNLGAAQMLAGDFAAAAPAFRKAIEIEPRATSHSNLAMMYYYLGRTPDAIAAIEQAIALQPDDHRYRSNLGDILWIDNQRENATQAFSRARELADIALEVNPNDSEALMNLAWIHAMLGHDDLARTGIERLKTLQPDNPYVYYYEGLILDRLGDADGALSAFNMAAEKGYPLSLLFADPHLISLREDSRFTTIVTAIKEDKPTIPD